MANTSNRTLNATLIEGIKSVKNYIQNSSAHVNLQGWAVYADAAGSTPVDATGGSPTLTLTRSTSSPLNGDANFLITKDAANRQGEGISYDFSIDRADLGKKLKIRFATELGSGSYSSGDLTVHIYDVTNANFRTLSATSVSATSTPGMFEATFNAASTSTSYRLAIHVATTSASAYTVKVDRVEVCDGSEVLPTSSPSNGQILIGGTNGFTPATITAGTNINVTNGDGTITISSTGGGGSGSSGPNLDMLRQLADLEAGTLPNNVQQNQFTDAFTSSKGTVSGGAASNRALRFNAGSNSMTYSRSKKSTRKASKAMAYAHMRLQALAPKGTTITANTIKFDGDVTGYFTASKNVIICTKDTQDGETTHQALLATAGTVALLPVSSVSFSSGETTVVLTNTDSLDLSMGLSSGNYNSKLRVIPFAYTLKGKTLTSDSLQTMSITDVIGTGIVGIPGENYFTRQFAGSITGTILKSISGKSPNDQYVVAAVLENDSGNEKWHIGYSTDKGKTFTKFTSHSTAGTAVTEEFGGFSGTNFVLANPSNIVVANNGKALITYFKNSASKAVFAVYTDLSIGTPVLSNTPATGSDSINTFDPSTPGAVASVNGNDFKAIVAADLTDLSYIAIACIHGSNSGFVRWYSNGGANHVGLSDNGYSSHYVNVQDISVTGTSPNRRTSWIRRDASTGDHYHTYWNEGSLSAVGNSIIFSSKNLVGVAKTIDTSSSKEYFMAVNLTDSNRTDYFSGTVSGTPSFSSLKTLSTLQADSYNGWSASDNNTYSKNAEQRIVVNPSNSNHIFLSTDLVHPDGIRRAAVFEVRDDTSFQGAHISQTGAASAITFRDTSSRTFIGQTVTANSNRFRTFVLRGYQVGNIPTGYSIQAKIYATSSSLPTGSVLYTSLNSYDPSKITKNSSGQLMYFTFDTPTLTNGVEYAVVLETSFPISASNYMQIIGQNSSGYASGQGVQYNGSVWSSAGSGFDWTFEVNGEFIYDMTANDLDRYGHDSRYAQIACNAAESTIAKIDSSNIQFLTRISPIQNTDAARPNVGHPYRSVITIGSGGTASTFTTLKPMGYAESNFDSNLVFATSLGNNECASIDLVTGAVSTTEIGEDRSGLNSNAIYNSVSAINYITDAAFQSGKALDLSGSSMSVQYDDFAVYDLYAGKAFAMEFEIKADTVAVGAKTICSFYHSTGGHGWVLQQNQTTSGDLYFSIHNTGGTVIGQSRSVSGVISVGTYTVVRVVYNPAVDNLIHIYTANSPSGSFSEVSYASQTAFSSGNTASGAALHIGAIHSPFTEFYDGKVGYAKIINGASSFAYTGYKSQPAIVSQVNLGAIGATAEQKIGANGSTGTNYDTFGLASPTPNEAAIQDSYDLIVQAEKTFTNSGVDLNFELTAERASSSDQSSIPAINVKYDA